jgi:hypothetical protein
VPGGGGLWTVFRDHLDIHVFLHEKHQHGVLGVQKVVANSRHGKTPPYSAHPPFLGHADVPVFLY